MVESAWEIYLTGFMLGLLGAGHCIGMCGGIMSALSLAGSSSDSRVIVSTVPRASISTIILYNTGRIISYTLIGFIFGFISQLAIQSWLASTGLVYLRILAGLLLVLAGLYIADWSKLLARFEKIGVPLWNRLRPISDRLLPVKYSWQALALGVIWGWLPCGLIYSTLALAIAQGNAFSSAGVMFAFGLGTFPALVLAGMATSALKKLFQSASFRGAMGIGLIFFGLWTWWGVYFHLTAHAHHHAHGSENHRNHPASSHHDHHSDATEQQLQKNPDQTPSPHSHHHH